MKGKAESTGAVSIELFMKVVGFAIGFTYLCGFLVVTIHLSEYGVSSISLLRTQYLAAGVLSLGPLCLTYVVAAMFYSSFEGFSFGRVPASGWPRLRGIVSMAGTVVWGLCKIFAVSSAIVDAAASIFVPTVKGLLLSHWTVFAWLTVESVVFTLVLMKTLRLAIRFGVEELHQDVKKILPAILLGAFSVLLFLAYMNYFARRLYSEIPFAIGGGKPQPVAFLLRQDPRGGPAPLVPDESGKRSIPYRLVLETDASYTVLSEVAKERAIQFNHDAVQGYVVLRER
jgi:hypothetical protein